MGNGIAQISATAGYDVCVLDVGEQELARTRAAIEKSLARLVRKETLTSGQSDETLARLRFTTDLADAVSNADIVVEAIPEELALKQEVFGQVVEHAPADGLLATNTRHIPISSTRR